MSKRRPTKTENGIFTQVNVRLFTEDVEKIKAEAAAAFELEWHPRLRRIVHEALRTRKVIR